MSNMYVCDVASPASGTPHVAAGGAHKSNTALTLSTMGDRGVLATFEDRAIATCTEFIITFSAIHNIIRLRRGAKLIFTAAIAAILHCDSSLVQVTLLKA
jgi:hypothetical protein